MEEPLDGEGLEDMVGKMAQQIEIQRRCSLQMMNGPRVKSGVILFETTRPDEIRARVVQAQRHCSERERPVF
jgi:hypothetical protein